MMNRNLGRRMVWRWVAAWSASALFLTFAIYGITSVFAQETTPAPVTSSEGESGSVPAPPGDCWGGALSLEPLHCYFLESAQRAGEIEVAAVYLAPGGGPLYIFLRQTEPITEEVGQFFETKAHEYVEREYNAGNSALPLGKCESYIGDERKACFNRALGNPSWKHFDPRQSLAFPRSVIYEDILIKIGGPDGRRTVPGWASWSQVWPSGTSGSRGASDGYDVSGVDLDLTNIPDPDCESFSDSQTPHGRGCYVRYLFFPDLPLAGWENQDDTLYVQIKDPPEDESELKALKDRLVPTWQEDGLEITLVPVKYDFEDLWRWSVILNRFAVSPGNTAGIIGGKVTFNHQMYGSLVTLPIVWLNGVEPVRWGDKITYRTILMVWAVDEEHAAAAMPELLPALGIPADAVSLVAHDDATPLKIEPAILHLETAPIEASTATSLQDVQNETEADVPAVEGQRSDAARTNALDGGDAAVGSLPSSGPTDIDTAPIEANTATSLQDVKNDTESEVPVVEGQYSDATRTHARDGDDASVGSLPSPAPTDVANTIPGVSVWTIVGGALVVILGAVLAGSLRMRRRAP